MLVDINKIRQELVDRYAKNTDCLGTEQERAEVFDDKMLPILAVLQLYDHELEKALQQKLSGQDS